MSIHPNCNKTKKKLKKTDGNKKKTESVIFEQVPVSQKKMPLYNGLFLIDWILAKPAQKYEITTVHLLIRLFVILECIHNIVNWTQQNQPVCFHSESISYHCPCLQGVVRASPYSQPPPRTFWIRLTMNGFGGNFGSVVDVSWFDAMCSRMYFIESHVICNDSMFPGL